MTRVKKGVSLDAVSAELRAITQRFVARRPNNYPKAGFRMKVRTLNDVQLQRFGGTLKVLMAVVGLLPVIGCASVSILLLAQATARHRDALAASPCRKSARAAATNSDPDGARPRVPRGCRCQRPKLAWGPHARTVLGLSRGRPQLWPLSESHVPDCGCQGNGRAL
jgi:hypothetical protein